MKTDKKRYLILEVNFMSARERVINVIDTMTDEQLEAFLNFFKAFADRSVIARIESAELAADQNPKLYNSFEEFMEEMESGNE